MLSHTKIKLFVIKHLVACKKGTKVEQTWGFLFTFFLFFLF